MDEIICKATVLMMKFLILYAVTLRVLCILALTFHNTAT